ncbi:MAG: phosphonate ABC transporter substrate-binding protein [Cyanobacteria bacterium J06648_16]
MTTQPWKRLSALTAATLLSAGMIAACSGGGTTDTAGTADTSDTGEVAEGGACAPEFEALEFGIISTESQDNLEPQWEPFLTAMSEELGREVIGFYATDYAGVIEAMGSGKIQMAWYGGKSYIEAAARSDAEAFAQTVNDDGTKGYYSHLITNKDNPIVAEIDLEAGNGDQYVIENAGDLTFAFNDPNSTSGFLVPTFYVFAQNDVNPEEAFSELIFAGSHEATGLAVAENQVDVATNNSENLARLEETAPDALENIQIIWTSPIIPSDPLAYRSDLPECLKADIQEFMYNFDDQEVLGGLGWQGLDPAKDEDWNTIRELEYGKQLLEVQNDDTLSEAAKQEKLDEINQKLEEVQS